MKVNPHQMNATTPSFFDTIAPDGCFFNKARALLVDDDMDATQIHDGVQVIKVGGGDTSIGVFNKNNNKIIKVLHPITRNSCDAKVIRNLCHATLIVESLASKGTKYQNYEFSRDSSLSFEDQCPGGNDHTHLDGNKPEHANTSTVSFVAAHLEDDVSREHMFHDLEMTSSKIVVNDSSLGELITSFQKWSTSFSGKKYEHKVQLSYAKYKDDLRSTLGKMSLFPMKTPHIKAFILPVHSITIAEDWLISMKWILILRFFFGFGSWCA